MNKRELLSRIPLFAKLSPQQLDRLTDVSVPRTFNKDTLLIKEGSPGLGMYVLNSGKVEIYKGEGENRTTLNVLENGAVVGEMSLIDEQARSASVRALEPTECLIISRDAFNTLLRQEPEISSSVMNVLVERIRNSHSRILDLESKAKQMATETTEEYRDLLTEEQPRRSSERRRTESARRGEEPRHPEYAEERGHTEYAGPAEERGRTEGDENDPLWQMMQAQRGILRAGVDWLSGAVGMFGACYGSIAEQAQRSRRSGVAQAVMDLPRRYFSAVFAGLDESMRVFQQPPRRGSAPEDTGRSYEVY